MASISLRTWNTTRVAELDEIENAHTQVGGIQRGRRFATQQINHAYAMLLSSQFQGFCRDLHSEAVDHIVRSITNNHQVRAILRAEFTLHRKLDKGNPTLGNIGADFNRLGVRFRDRVRAQSGMNERRIAHLEDLNKWRNAIAHQDFEPNELGGTITLQLAKIRRWRIACQHLANTFDKVIGDHIFQLSQKRPW